MEKTNFCGLRLPPVGEERQSFRNGGLVTGPGDIIPARIPSGSIVINADAVRVVGADLLSVLNNAAFLNETDVDLSPGDFVILPPAASTLGRLFFDRLNAAGQLQRAGALGDSTAVNTWHDLVAGLQSVLGGRNEPLAEV